MDQQKEKQGQPLKKQILSKSPPAYNKRSNIVDIVNSYKPNKSVELYSMTSLKNFSKLNSQLKK